ncbi:MAG TPA: hypothetical protein VK203_00785 [Nostocaceae cyanobacterium]|nr:hypothetical protein [Nostocaceae cyanobacterium]
MLIVFHEQLRLSELHHILIINYFISVGRINTAQRRYCVTIN